MEEIRDQFDTLVGEMWATYVEGRKKWPRLSVSITEELQTVRDRLDTMIQLGGHSSIDADWSTDLEPSWGANLASLSQIGDLNNSNQNMALFATSMPPAFVGEDYSTTFRGPAWDYTNNPTMVCANCLRVQPVGTSCKRKRKSKADGLGHPRPLDVSRTYQEIGELRALSQLRILLRELRAKHGWDCDWQTLQLPNIICALSRIDELRCTSAFLCRVLLLRLLNQRDRMLRDISLTEPELDGSKLESLVLDDMTYLADPTITEEPPKQGKTEWRKKYGKLRTSLRNRLMKARGWQSAIDVLGIGCLALFPTGTDGDLRNYRFEVLCIDQRQSILQDLRTKHNGHLQAAASNLQPFVQAIYDGRNYETRLAIEKFEETEIMKMDIKDALALCKELPIESANSTLT